MSDTVRPRISVINDNADFLELTSAIRDEDAGYDVTVFKHIGNVHVLAKPFGIDEVTGLVERLVGRGQPVAGYGR